MKRTMLWATLALAVVALGLMPVVANAQVAAFKAELTPEGAFPVPGGKNNETIIDLAGTSTHLGLCAAEADNFGDYKHDPWVGWGTMVLVAANGDMLRLEYEFTYTGTGWVGTCKITGGTGLFLEASGSGDLALIINYTSPPTWCFDGTISF